MSNVKRTSIRLTKDEWRELLAICTDLGCLSTRGSKVGSPSWITLVNRIADDVYVTSVNPNYEEKEDTAASGWKSLGIPTTDARIAALTQLATAHDCVTQGAERGFPSWRRLVKDIALGRVIVSVPASEGFGDSNDPTT